MQVHLKSFDRLAAISSDHKEEAKYLVQYPQARGFTLKCKVLPRDCLTIVVGIAVLGGPRLMS